MKHTSAHRLIRSASLAAAIATLLATSSARATSTYWTGLGSDSEWSNTGNWNAAPVPGASDTATFNGAGNSKTTIDLGAGVTIKTIAFDLAAAAAYTIGSGAVGSQTLTFSSSGTVTMASTVTQNQLFNANIVLGTTGAADTAALTISNEKSGKTVTFAGTIQGGTGGTAGAKTLSVNNTYAVTLSGDISNGGASSVGISKLKSGTLILSGTNTYTGQTKLNNFGGQTNVLRANDGVGLPADSNLLIQVGVFETGVDLVRAGGTGAGQMQLIGSITTPGTVNGFSANGGPVNVAFGTLANPTALTWGSGDFQPLNQGGLLLNHTTANNTLDFKNAVNLGGAVRSVSVNATNSAAIATMSGNLTGSGASGLTKTGVGTLVLSGANTYTGPTVIRGGTLSVGSLTDGGALNSSIGSSSNAAANLGLGGGGILKYTGTGADMDRNFTVGAGGGTIDASGASNAALIFNTSAVISPDVESRNGTTNNNKILTGLTSTSDLFVGMPVAGAGIATGATIASIDSASQITLTTSTNITAGTRSVNFGYGARTLSLTGTSTGANTIAGNLQDGATVDGKAGTLGLTKDGAGTWKLTGTNTYTGGTTISNGKLLVNGSLTGSGAVSVASGATLGGSGSIAGATMIGSGGIHAPGNSPGVQAFTSALTYTDGSIFSWEIDRTKDQAIRGTGYDAVNVTGTLAGLDGADANTTTDAIFRIIIGDAGFTDDFWTKNNHTWANIFTESNGTTVKSSWAGIFGGGFEYYNTNGTALVSAPTTGTFSLSDNTLSWNYSAVPEPSSVLAGLLLGAGLLRRRR